MTTNAQRQLHQALMTHTSDLEIERGAALDCDLDDRIEAARQLLEWLEQALETPTFRQAQPDRKTHAHVVGETFRRGETRLCVEVGERRGTVSDVCLTDDDRIRAPPPLLTH
jgi:hypothetical protein